MKAIRFGEEKKRDASPGIHIVVTGDFYPDSVTEALCRDNRMDQIFNDTLAVLRQKDLSIVNLECPLVENKAPISKTGQNLGADPVCIRALQYAGFDVAALANNHILDQGAAGIHSTLDICAQYGVQTVGVGSNITEALRPLYIERKGKRIAIINVAEHEFSIATKNRAGAAPLDAVSNYYQIMEAKSNSDIQLVIVHGGVQHYPLPTPTMVKTYRFFADLGVTAVIGHHAHCASGYECYHGVPIFYSLGNFLFNLGKRKSPLWYEGYFIKLIIEDDKVVGAQLYSYYQSKGAEGVRLIPAEEESEYWKKIKGYCDIIAQPDRIEEEWTKLCKRFRRGQLLAFMHANKFLRKLAKRRLLPGWFFKKNKDFWLIDLNRLRCPAHREVAIEILKQETGVQ